MSQSTACGVSDGALGSCAGSACACACVCSDCWRTLEARVTRLNWQHKALALALAPQPPRRAANTQGIRVSRSGLNVLCVCVCVCVCDSRMSH